MKFWPLFLFSVLSVSPITVYGQSPASDWEQEFSNISDPGLLPAFRNGCIVEQISSYDRTGGNDDGFSGKYSFVRKENGKLVLADLKGPGIINRIYTPTPVDDTLSFYFDGEKEPRISLPMSELFSGNSYPFVKPLCGNQVGGYFCYVPIPYEKSCKVVLSAGSMQFYHLQYRSLPGHDVKSFSYDRIPSSSLEKACRAWEERMVPDGGESRAMEFSISPGEEKILFRTRKPGRILGFEFSGAEYLEGLYKDLVIEARWDDEDVPAICAPVQDFFGYAFGKRSMSSVLAGTDGSLAYFYLPCPFDKNAEVKLKYIRRTGVAQSALNLGFKVYFSSEARDAEKEGKFYAIWNREIRPEDGKHYTFAECKGKGHFVGVIQQAQGLIPGITEFFEGDDSVYVDGAMRIHGTGSEDLYNGGWYALLDRWDRGVSLPIHGSLDYSIPMSRTGGYRFYLSDKLSFEKDFYFGIEHGPVGNRYPVDYTSVAFCYLDAAPSEVGEPDASLREVYIPDVHIFYPQLMKFNIGGAIKVSLTDFVCTEVNNDGRIRIDLSEIPEGRYKVYLTYRKGKSYADFRVWQRQTPVMDWRSASASEDGVADKEFLGEVSLTGQTSSLSFEIRKAGTASKFDFKFLYLEKVSE